MTLKLNYEFKCISTVQNWHWSRRECHIRRNAIVKSLCPQSSYSSDETPLGLNQVQQLRPFGVHTIPHYGTCALIIIYLIIVTLNHMPSIEALLSPADMKVVAHTVLEIIFFYSQDIITVCPVCPFKSSFWSDILQIGWDIIY